MMVVKSVAFNTKDPDQLNMLEHANKRPNFSAYVKRLIQRDMEGWHASAYPIPESKPSKPSEIHINQELASQLI